MPVEVRELIIKGIVVQEGNDAGTSPGSSGSTSGNNGADPQEELIRMCADKVLQLLREKHER